jgi:hypothetical protein
MKGALMSVSDRVLLRKRALIETINDELKNIAQIEHSRHRSFEKAAYIKIVTSESEGYFSR